MRTRRRDLLRAGLLALVAALAAVLVSTAGAPQARRRAENLSAVGWRGLVGEQRVPVSVGQRVLVVLRAPSLADRVANAGGLASDVDERRWTASAFASQQQLISDLGQQGVRVRPELRFTRVLNGFSAALDASAVAALERAPAVAGVYPVRVAFPASLSSRLLAMPGYALGGGRRPDVVLPGFDGRGVTIGLLDTGVDSTQPFLRGRILDGVDIVGDGDAAVANPKPGDPAIVERHGTQMAGILVGAGGPTNLAGIAPGAAVLPIRVAGWQRDAAGGWSIYARSDQLLAGLERVVDPNGDGDAHDAVRVALVPLAEPFAAFTDSPEARAVEGARQLDTLVVVPAGNDGPAAPSYGSVAGPGGAPSALTVGASDLRRETQQARVIVRDGLDVLLDRYLPLAGAVQPRSAVTLQLARTPKRTIAQAQLPAGPVRTPPIGRFFDQRGFSAVAGRAALVPAGATPEVSVRDAVTSGAGAVVLYGTRIPAGAVGLREDVPVPVIGIEGELAKPLLLALARGRSPVVSIGSPRPAANPDLGRVAPFSSYGLAFDGRIKPELTAGGIEIVTAEPGVTDDGLPRFSTVNGSSAAAAQVAGAAAVLLQARPSLDADGLRGLLVGTARVLRRTPEAEGGAGLVDIGAAATGELAADPVTIDFGALLGQTGQTARRWLVVRNVSTRPLTVYLSPGAAGAAAAVSLSGTRVVLEPRQAVRVRVRVRVTAPPGDLQAATGALVATPVGGRPLRVPWAVRFGPLEAPLLSELRLSAKSFPASDAKPAVLALVAGSVTHTVAGDAIQPLARLDVELWTADRSLGTVARLRDLLPGSYAFGLTGRGPAGAVLRPGRYFLVLVATPTGGDPPIRRRIEFRITEP